MKKMNGNKLYKIKILLIDYNYLFNSYLKIFSKLLLINFKILFKIFMYKLNITLLKYIIILIFSLKKI